MAPKAAAKAAAKAATKATAKAAGKATAKAQAKAAVKAVAKATVKATAKAKAAGKAVGKAKAKTAMTPSAADAKAKGKARAEAKAEAKATVQVEQKEEQKPVAAVPAKRAPPPAAAAQIAAAAPSVEPPAKKAKVDSAASPDQPTSAADDPLALAPLFAGAAGDGSQWENVLRPVLNGLPQAPKFIGPGRDKRIVPVREMTFQALKPNPPANWCVVSLGQSPYPRLESATGIAHFDNTVKDWQDKRFGVVTTLRCMIKAAAIHKYGVPKNTDMPSLRELLKEKNTVGPTEWFQAMLTQGVLLMNAALTLLPPEEKSVRAGTVVQEHTSFWQPVVETIVDAIIRERTKLGLGVVFAWWGTESLKTKKALTSCFNRYPEAKIKHVEHKNPAAMYDSFCDDPNVFGVINGALKSLGLPELDWLPSHGWKDQLPQTLSAGGNDVGLADKMGAFMEETQELHKMYLERLRDGLGERKEELADITGVAGQPLVPLAQAFTPAKLKTAAEASVKKAESMSRGELNVDEAGAVHLYTTNHIYKQLNAALRAEDRHLVQQYLRYLRLFFEAARKMPPSTRSLYRGVALDLSDQYPEGATVTWWSVSSCTPELKVAEGFANGAKASTLFVIEPKTSVGIRHLSEYAHEEEFIFLPGTQFKVKKVLSKGKGKVEVHLEELDLPLRVQ